MSYAGDLSPQEAWAKLEDGAILVDVRTEGEWAHIGIPDTAAAGESATIRSSSSGTSPAACRTRTSWNS